METLLVVVSVLCTLVIVAIGISIVVFTNILKGKVDVIDLDGVIRDNQDREKDISYELRDINRKIERETELYQNEFFEFQREVDRSSEELNSRLDSRCDKLYDQIRNNEERLRNELEQVIDEINSRSLSNEIREEMDRFKRDVEEKIEHLVEVIENNKKDDKDLLTD